MPDTTRTTVTTVGLRPPHDHHDPQELRRAALVIARSPGIRAWLLANDPKALAQLDAALAAHPNSPPASTTLDIPAGAFKPIGEMLHTNSRRDDHLHATVTINGVDFEVDAYAVRMVKGVQEALEADADLSVIHHAVGADGPFQTVRIGRRNYVLVLTPYC
jgi:hypothetical protein